MIGQTISHYRILEEVGRGGMGIVYKAEDILLHRPVALKFLPAELTRDIEARERFAAEAQAASALDHPNIAVVHEIAETEDGSSFICMAYYEGKTLKEMIDKGPRPLDQTIDIAIQLAEGLRSAHEVGIIHRDLKPANVIVTDRGEVKIVDFGLAKLLGRAKLTTTGRTLGTAAYMSPEQARGGHVDSRTDIWSLGVLLSEMLTGQRPFRSEYEQAVIYAILNEEPAAPSTLRADTPAELESVVKKCMQKEPGKRFQTAGELLHELRRSRTEYAPRGPVARRAISFARRVIPSTPTSFAIPSAAAVVGLIALILLVPSVRTTLEHWIGVHAIPEQINLAVLPFTNIGGSPTTQPFCDGLVETMTSKLTQLEQFHGALLIVPASDVRARNVLSAAEARKEFGVTLVVSGSVQRQDSEVRMTLNLVDAESLRQLRSSVIDARMTNVSALQDGILTNLAEMLNLELQPQSLQMLAEGSTDLPHAYDLYLQGRGYLQRYERAENIEAAIDLFQRAIVEDSTYALAYAGLGEAYWHKYGTTKDPEWIELAVKTCQRSLNLNDRSAPVHVSLGLIYTGTGRYAEALQEFERALLLDPVNADAFSGMAGAYEGQGELEEVESTYRKAIEMKPSYWAHYNRLGVFYYHRGRYKDAAKQFTHVVDLTPDNFRGYNNLGGIYVLLGRWSEAQSMFERSIKIKANYDAFSNLGTLFFFHGAQYTDAARMYEKALELDDSDYRVWGSLASAYYWSAGEHSRANDAYQHAAALAEQELKVNPRDAAVLSHLAAFYAMMGESRKALSRLEKSIAMTPVDVDVMARTAETFELLGFREKALQWIQTALQNRYELELVERNPALGALRNDERYRRFAREITHDDGNK